MEMIIKKIKKSAPLILVLTIPIISFLISGFTFKIVEADEEAVVQQVNVGNSNPTVGTVVLNGGSAIGLTESVTTTVQATATVTDTDTFSDFKTIEGKVYYSGVGSGCTANDNTCYSDSLCATSSCGGNSCVATCEYEVWFHATPTDTDSSFWETYIKAIDKQDASSTATTSQELSTLRALGLSTSSIAYGSLDRGEDTSTLSKNQTTTATGNEAIDIYIYGTRMEKDPWSSLDYEIATTGITEHDGGNGEQPAIIQVDATHYLTTYRTSNGDAMSQILEVDDSDWSATSVSVLEFDSRTVAWPVITQVDAGHYLITYGESGTGWSAILEINTSTWAITTSTANFQFEPATTSVSAVAQIDASHYLVAYMGGSGTWNPGWATVLNVNTSTWAISTSSAPFKFIPDYFLGPAIDQINSSHYLVAYEGANQDGWATVLDVNTSTWVIATSTTAIKYEDGGRVPDIASIDSDTNHFLLVYRYGSTGKSIFLEVDTSTWAVTATGSSLIYDPNGGWNPAIAQMDSTHYFVVDRAQDADGWAVVLEINTSTWAVATSSSNFEFEPVQCTPIDVAKVDSSHYLAVYTGPLSDGWSVVLNPYLPNVIPVEYQEYATSGVNYASGTDFTTSVTVTLELDMSKPTSNPSTSTDEIYWGLKIPSYVQKGSYYGTGTYEAKAD